MTREQRIALSETLGSLGQVVAETSPETASILLSLAGTVRVGMEGDLAERLKPIVESYIRAAKTIRRSEQ